MTLLEQAAARIVKQVSTNHDTGRIEKATTAQQEKQLQNDFMGSGTHIGGMSTKRRVRRGGKTDRHGDKSQVPSFLQGSRASRRKNLTKTWASQSTPDPRDENVSHLFGKKIPYRISARPQHKIGLPEKNPLQGGQESNSHLVQPKNPMDKAKNDTSISDGDKAPRFVTVKDWTGDRAGGGEASHMNNPVAQNQTSAALNSVAVEPGACGRVGGGGAGPVCSPEKNNHTSSGHGSSNSITEISNILKIKDREERAEALCDWLEAEYYDEEKGT